MHLRALAVTVCLFAAIAKHWSANTFPLWIIYQYYISLINGKNMLSRLNTCLVLLQRRSSNELAWLRKRNTGIQTDELSFFIILFLSHHTGCRGSHIRERELLSTATRMCSMNVAILTWHLYSPTIYLLITTLCAFYDRGHSNGWRVLHHLTRQFQPKKKRRASNPSRKQ